MKRISKLEIETIAIRVLDEIDLHFTTQKVLKHQTKRDFNFWNVKEYDILIEFNHYCNLRDLSFCDEDIKEYHKILQNMTNENYIFNCIIKDINIAIFYIKDK